MNILLTSVGRRSYLVHYFREALGDKGKIHVSNSSALTPAFSAADCAVLTPMIYDKEYIPFLLSYCKNNHIKVIVSLFDIDLPILSKHKKEFKEIGVSVIVSDRKVIEICNDKYLTYRFLIDNGFLSPKTYLTIDDALTAIENKEIEYPLIVKPRWGMGSIGVLIAENQEELYVFYKKTLGQIKNSYLKYESLKNIDESIIIQEMLKGQEYGLDIINNLNQVYQNTIVKVKHAMRSGETDCAEVVDNSLLKETGKSLSNKLGHVGNLDVDVFLVDEKPYILEMNARFGGGYPFSHIAGVNLPKAIMQWVSDEEVSIDIFKEEFGVIAHKDLSIVQINNREKTTSKSEVEIEIKQLKSEIDILLALNDFNNVFSPPISERIKDIGKVENIKKYSEKLHKHAFFYVAKDIEKLGFIIFYANNYDDKTSYISFIGVKQNFQNKRIGEKLLKVCIEKSLEMGMKYIRLRVQKDNQRALSFYKKNGFSYEKKDDEESFYIKKTIGSD